MHLALGIGTRTLVTIDLSVWRSQEATLLKHDLIFTYLAGEEGFEPSLMILETIVLGH